MNRKWTWAIPCVVLGVGFVAIQESKTRLPQKPFDREIWNSMSSYMNDGGREVSERQAMVVDLVKNKLPGMTRNEVAAFLAPPENPPLVRNPSGDDRPELVYELGMERFLLRGYAGFWGSGDDEWLILKFHPDGTFEEASVLGSEQWAELLVNVPNSKRILKAPPDLFTPAKHTH